MRTITAITTATALAACFTATGCSDEGGRDDGSFPNGFLIGAATAGFQVDMGCPTLPDAECVDPNSDWYQYVTSPETLALDHTHLNGEDPAIVGPGHWELYAHDFDLAQADGHTVLRMSLEWSRIFPTSTVGIDGYDALRAAASDDALAHYHAVFAALHDRGITPYVTIHHYTLPTWIHDGVGCTLDLDNCSPRGWLDADTTVHEIAKYAGFVAREFGGDVDWWATENEPFAVLLPGYLLPTAARSNPPAASLRAPEAKVVFNALVEAHARMYDAVHANDTADADGDGVAASVGLVYAMAPVAPLDPENDLDVQAADNVFYLWNLAFLNAVAGGVLDDDLDGTGEPNADLAGRMDHLGVNYKVRITVRGLASPLLPSLSPLTTFDPLSIRQDEVYPRGIYEMATLVRDRYGLPVVITENNGQAVPSGDYDTEERLVAENLQWLLRAIDDGVDVRGYIYWALMDNYEWNHGTDVRLGLYAVDPTDPDKTRTPRPTAAFLSRIAHAGGVPPDVATQYPVAPRP